MTHLKRPWCWERLTGGEGDDRRWDGWMASPTQWTWVWVNFGSWWWTGRPGMLRLMGSQRVGHNWGTELNWGSPPISELNVLTLPGPKLPRTTLDSKQFSLPPRKFSYVETFINIPWKPGLCYEHKALTGVLMFSGLSGKWFAFQQKFYGANIATDYREFLNMRKREKTQLTIRGS